MTNFDFLLKRSEFSSFSGVAISSEKLLHIDTSACALSCRRAMEFAVKWVYSADSELRKPYSDNLSVLMNTKDFRELVGEDIYRRMELVRRLGNSAAHDSKKVSLDEAKTCLENLFVFLDFVCYCYIPGHKEQTFNESLLELTVEEALEFVSEKREENRDTKHPGESHSSEHRRKDKLNGYAQKPIDLSEYKTRSIYVNLMLEDAGWIEGVNRQSDLELGGYNGDGKTTVADCVLFGDDGIPLAIVESKYTFSEPSKGKKIAMRCADIIESSYGKRPIVFLSGGFDCEIIEDRHSKKRRIASVYSKSDLEKLFKLREKRKRASSKGAAPDLKIIDRYYQKEAVSALFNGIVKNKERRALLSMAAGSGKTRTAAAFCKLLFEYKRAERILFLADKDIIVTQTRRVFEEMMPAIMKKKAAGEYEFGDAPVVFADYRDIVEEIDEKRDSGGKRIYTVGHFDLVILDEIQPSLYKKYKDVISYFDAPLVGLTSSEAGEIDRSIYELFELEEGAPSYSYPFKKAVEDGYLVNFELVENTPFSDEGECRSFYDALSGKEREQLESTFDDDFASAPISEIRVQSCEEEGIKRMLDSLVNKGLYIDGGKTLGKTVIFVNGMRFAEKILSEIEREYTEYKGYAELFYEGKEGLQGAIDRFSEKDGLPRIAISVNALDMGIDIPEILNLVFAKKVVSKARFIQMIGRGARPCKGIFEKENRDKECFRVFDFCSNFEFFRINETRKEDEISLSASIFKLRIDSAVKLKNMIGAEKSQKKRRELSELFDRTVALLCESVGGLDRESFAVRQHLRFVERFSHPSGYKSLTFADAMLTKSEILPLMRDKKEKKSALLCEKAVWEIILGRLENKDTAEKERTLIDLAQKSKNLEKTDKNRISDSESISKMSLAELFALPKKLR